nr:hypothetical protein [uncultured Methanolobus sp.]
MKYELKQTLIVFAVGLLLINLIFLVSAGSNVSVNSTSYAGARPIDLPDFYPQIFDQLKEQDDNYILGKGEVPLIISESGKRNWLNDLNNVKTCVKDEMTAKYMRPNGSVMSYGYNYHGYLSVQFPVAAEVNESMMDAIYSIFNEEAMKTNISNVPVLFQYSPEITVGESFDAVDVEFYDEPAIINETVNNTEDSRDIPGFTFLISILAFLIASGKR